MGPRVHGLSKGPDVTCVMTIISVHSGSGGVAHASVMRMLTQAEFVAQLPRIELRRRSILVIVIQRPCDVETGMYRLVPIGLTLQLRTGLPSACSNILTLRCSSTTHPGTCYVLLVVAV